LLQAKSKAATFNLTQPV